MSQLLTLFEILTCEYLFRLFSKSVVKENVQSSGNSDLNSRLIHEDIVSRITFIMYAQNRKIGKPNNLKFWEQ